ncbi:NEDD8-activating enzyme E1 regulatory subunit-like [Gigantopelta aegis]|uniref:NEDD8-activating enzyme E1 regulatory subunit-like n=1 Tax=Gigantopelta aegis TaxID=1735272 RepID=UPI001B8895CC|nr:NEDD8-activating enzyme E1 regulatory subunit-like [Gigantopelta aegis]
MAATTKSGIDKSRKYDRQLRLWGDHGQAALESARVCLINATATGTEILKNLILPGIGSFTIVDGNKVSGEDVGNNFFLSKESLGKSRAQVATDLLSELNEDVTGDFVEESPEKLLETNRDVFTSFSIVVATDVCERTLLQLGDLLWERNIPLIVCRCYGFIGYMRLVAREHTVVESHPDNAFDDLRLADPFPGLVEYCDSLDLNTMNKKVCSSSVLSAHAYLFGDRTGRILRNEDGIPEDEENFEEAVIHVNAALVAMPIPSEVKILFDDDNCCNLHPESKSFWILVRAIKEFVGKEGKGKLPLRGTIPDMTSDSMRYIQLQNVYRSQAAEDVITVTGHVQELLQEIGRDEPLNLPTRHDFTSVKSVTETITDGDIKMYCRNAAFLRVVRCRSLQEEYNNETANVQEIGMHLEDEEGDDVVFYVMLRAVDKFYEEFNRYPGWYNDQVEADVARLKTCVGRVLHDWGLTPTVKDDYIHEMCRYGASELHTVSAFMGGVVAQEVIKIITGQFLPFNNTFIYNAMKQTSSTVCL